MAKTVRFSLLLTVALAALLFAQSKRKPQSPIRMLHKPTGMTVHAGTHMPDDKEHCFKEDDKRSLYFDVVAEITTGRAYVDLYDLGDFSAPPELVEQSDEKIAGGLSTVVIKGHAQPPSTAVSTAIQHLGPGPYVAVVSTATSIDKKDRASTIAGVSRYYYETFSSDPNECSH